MAIVIRSQDIDKYRLDEDQKLWVYNGLDSLLTKEVFDNLSQQLDAETTARTYRFSKAMLGPALAMMRRGIRVDLDKRDAAVAEMVPRMIALGGMAKGADGKWAVVNDSAPLQLFAQDILGTTEPFNYHSRQQREALLFEALKIEPYLKLEKGQRKVSTGREALEHLKDYYPRAEPIARILLKLAIWEKQYDVLTKGLDADGRIRCSYNVVGTETGRWSSSTSVFNTGTNLQNITEELRYLFVPDPGKVLVNIDLEQAESRTVAYLAGDEAYIQACESGDLHTTVASMVFGIPAEVEAAAQKYYLHFSYRDMAKRAGHGTNYGLKPHSLARIQHITVQEAYNFQMRYLGGELPYEQAAKLNLLGLDHERVGNALIRFPGAFPGIRAWHDETDLLLQSQGWLVTPFARKRTFWNRLADAATLREAIAYVPQSTIGDLLNLALWRVWLEFENAGVELLAQVHDSIVFQIDEDKVASLLPRVLSLMDIPVPVRGRTMLIPAEAQVGRNWGKFNEKTGANPAGLQKWKQAA